MRFFESQGNLEVSTTYVNDEGFMLGKWITEQRRCKRRGDLENEKIERLNAIGMHWENPSKDRWHACLDAVRRYPRDPSGMPIVPAEDVSEFGTKLKYWVEHQQRKYRRGKLDSLQKKQWEKMINEPGL